MSNNANNGIDKALQDKIKNRKAKLQKLTKPQLLNKLVNSELEVEGLKDSQIILEKANHHYISNLEKQLARAKFMLALFVVLWFLLAVQELYQYFI